MKETLTRLVSGILYIIILITATYFSFKSFLLLFGFFMVVCVFEFCELVHIRKTVPVALSIVGYVLFSSFSTTQNTQLLLLLASLFVTVKCILLLFNEKSKRTDAASGYVYLFGYIIIPFILITKIPLNNYGYDPKIIISLFILIWTNDTFAFIVGKSIGKRKLLERISPKKTIEGLAGGLVFALIFSIFIAIYYLRQPVWHWIIIALIVGVFGTIGDLVESKFKRSAGVKDSGKIMPGHGGILDRLDSVIFAAPIVFLFYQILKYVS